ncbi:Protein PUTATIVE RECOMBINATION INITIATION DEFECT 1, partial [Frankliniella fusca]
MLSTPHKMLWRIPHRSRLLKKHHVLFDFDLLRRWCRGDGFELSRLPVGCSGSRHKYEKFTETMSCLHFTSVNIGCLTCVCAHCGGCCFVLHFSSVRIGFS